MIPKTLIQITALLFALLACSQERKPIAKGTITITTSQKIKFRDLKYVDDQVVFTNVDTNSRFTYFLNSVRLILDDQDMVLYAKPETGIAENTVYAPKPKGPAYPESGMKNTVKAEIIKTNGDTLYTNLKVSTLPQDRDRINELSITEKILTVENKQITEYKRTEIQRIKFKDYDYIPRTFVRNGDGLMEILFDGKIKWYRVFFLDIIHGVVQHWDYMVNETHEKVNTGLYLSTRKAIKNITKNRPDLIPAINQMNTDEDGIRSILELYDK